MISAYLIIKKESLRVPNKNFRPLGKKPLYQWCIDTLLEIDLIDEVVINTDTPESFTELSKYPKIRIISRKKELLGHHITANTLILSDLDNIKSKNIMMTHVTTPFVSKKTYIDAISKFQSSKNQTLLSVTKSQNRFFFSDKRPVNHNPELLLPTQELEPLFLENSCIYLFSKKQFLEHNSRVCADPLFFETPNYESLDIDTLEDWMNAEILAKGYEEC